MNLEIIFMVLVVVFILNMIAVILAYIDINRKLENMEDIWEIIYRQVIAPKRRK